MKRIGWLLLCLIIGLPSFAQNRQIWVEVEIGNRSSRERLTSNFSLITADGREIPARMDTAFSTRLLYFDLPIESQAKPLEVTLRLYDKETTIELPATDELIFLHTEEGDYFPHDLTVWKASELWDLYQKEIKYQQEKRDNDISIWVDDADLTSVKDIDRFISYAMEHHYRESSELADRMEEFGNALFTILGILLGLILVGMMITRVRLHQQLPDARWIKAEKWLNFSTYAVLGMIVLHAAFFFDFEIISFNGPPSYVVELNSLAESLLGMLIIAVFGLNSAYLVPNYLVRRDYQGYFLRVAALFGLCLLPYIFLNDWLLTHHFAWVDGNIRFHALNEDPDQDMMALIVAIWVTSTLLISTFISANRLFIRQRLDQLDLQRTQLSANLRQLQAQISPHFFFNTLNSVYGFALQENSPRTVEALEKLSSLMRFAIYQGNEPYIPLEQEINYLNDYVDLQKLRLDPQKHEVQFEVNGEVPDAHIAPLLLITLIENAFKHGLSMRHPSFIHIQLDLNPSQLTLQVSNSTHPDKQQETGGLGLVNIRQRLDLLYPDRYTWTSQQGPDRYETMLQLTLVRESDRDHQMKH